MTLPRGLATGYAMRSPGAGVSAPPLLDSCPRIGVRGRLRRNDGRRGARLPLTMSGQEAGFTSGVAIANTQGIPPAQRFPKGLTNYFTHGDFTFAGEGRKEMSEVVIAEEQCLEFVSGSQDHLRPEEGSETPDAPRSIQEVLDDPLLVPFVCWSKKLVGQSGRVVGYEDGVVHRRLYR